jgi:recombination protein RecT
MLVRATQSDELEVYMARRSAQSSFMPDAYVFPGGALDAADATEQAVSRLDRAPESVEPEFAVAAIRELFEEAGILLAMREDGSELRPRDIAALREALAAGRTFGEAAAHAGLRLRGAALFYYSRWVTPPDVKRRFDTRFFIASEPADQVATADAYEMHDGVWIRPSEAVQRGECGEWTLVFPTIRHLERLASLESLGALFEHARSRRPEPVMPSIGSDGMIRLPEGAW